MRSPKDIDAVIFDCDGVLVETERDGHRVTFNRAFAAMNLKDEWSVERYGILLKTAGGKERMIRHFDEVGWPVAERERGSLIKRLHELKTGMFLDLVRSGQLSPRPGVIRLVDEAIHAGLKLAVCSTSNELAVQAIVDTMLGPERSRHIRVFAGDIVLAKKPDPAIYMLASSTLDVTPSRCLVIEDSNNGLRAALAAAMRCIVTVSYYTHDEDFSGAERVVPELGDGDSIRIRLSESPAGL